MELSRNLKKILLVGMSALMFASVGAGTGNLTANAKRRYRPRVVRRVRRYRRRATHCYRKHAVRPRHAVNTKGINSHNEWSKHPSKAQLAYFATHAFNFRDKDGGLDGDTSGKDYANIHHVSINKAYHNLIKIMNGKALYQKQSNKLDSIDNDKVNVAASKYAVDYINRIRSEHGVNTLSTDPGLTKIAYQRAVQNEHTTGHYDSNGNTYMSDDAANDNIPLSSTWGENLLTSNDRSTYMYANKTKNPNSSKVSKDMAKSIYRFMNDEPHRYNTLSSDYNWVGIGITNNGSVAEDFEG